MESLKDKRTKNLTLHDIHVGDWVQKWSPMVERYSSPMKVSYINYDGTVYLVSDDEHYCDHAETEIENVDALPITEEVLIGFGFIEDKDNPNTYKLLLEEREGVYPDNYLYAEKCRIGYDFYFKDYKFNGFAPEIEIEHLPVYENYIHELQEMMHHFFKVHKLEWKGIER